LNGTQTCPNSKNNPQSFVPEGEGGAPSATGRGSKHHHLMMDGVFDRPSGMDEGKEEEEEGEET